MAKVIVKRVEDFFERQLDSVDPKGATDICEVARTIYDIWSCGGREDLEIFLKDELGLDPGEANLIALRYNPSRPPVDFCPIGTIKRREFNKVFEKLSLQLPSRNNENGVWPKNLLGWRVMQYIYGVEILDFKIRGETGSIRDNRIDFKNLPLAEDGEVMPFGLAALNVINSGDIPASVLQKCRVLLEVLGEEVGRDLARSLMESEAIFPPKRVLRKLADNIKRGLGGEQVIITGAFCPDYSYREVNDPKRPTVKYEYTFNDVGEGVGLVAAQIRRMVPYLIQFLEQYDIKYRVVFSIGDFEANSPEILDSVGLDRESFISRCRGSLYAFREALPTKMDLFLFAEELANGRWELYRKEAESAFKRGDFGKIKSVTGKDPRREIKFIAKDGRKFYRRWFNRSDMPIEDIEQVVISQAAEYAAMGKIISEDFGGYPVIQLAGDRPKMQIFNNKDSGHPTICAKRVY